VIIVNTTSLLSVLVIIVFLVLILIMAQTQLGLAQPKTGQALSEDILKTCTPYSSHTRTLYVVPDYPGGGAITCGQALGTVKHLCDQARNSVNQSPVCADPRYLSWLRNDFPNYPLDEWFGTNVP
jgi:hypothetical protein